MPSHFQFTPVFSQLLHSRTSLIKLLRVAIHLIGRHTACFLNIFFTNLLTYLLNRQNDSSGIIYSCSGCGGPHTAHRTAKINNVLQISIWFYWSLSSAYQVFHLLSKGIVLLNFLLSHNRLRGSFFYERCIMYEVSYNGRMSDVSNYVFSRIKREIQL